MIRAFRILWATLFHGVMIAAAAHVLSTTAYPYLERKADSEIRAVKRALNDVMAQTDIVSQARRRLR